MKAIALFSLAIMLFSCSEKDKIPPEVISSEKMSAIMWDMIRAQVLATEIARKDSSVTMEERRKALTEKVFEFHHIASAAFDESYNWYTDHPNIFKVIFDSLYTRKQRQSEQLMRDGRKSLRVDSLSKKILIK